MIHPRHLQVLVLATLLGLALPSFASAASATEPTGTCDPAVLQDLINRYKLQQADIDASLEPLEKKIQDRPKDSMELLSSCVDLSWPTISLSWPTMDMIIRGIAKELVKKACGEIRDKMSDVTSKLSGSFYLNTRIPGVPDIGGGVSMSSAPASLTLNGSSTGLSSGLPSSLPPPGGISGLFRPRPNPTAIPPKP